MLLKQALNSSIMGSSTNAEGSQVLMQFIRQREADVEIKFKQLLQQEAALQESHDKNTNLCGCKPGTLT